MAFKYQRGAVLVLCLAAAGLMASVLLLNLGSAWQEWLMSTQEVQRARAQAAAQAGLEAAMRALAAAPPPGGPPGTPLSTPPGLDAAPLGENGAERVSTRIEYLGEDAAMFAASAGLETGQHFLISVTGSALRGARARITADVLVRRALDGRVIAASLHWWKRPDAD